MGEWIQTASCRKFDFLDDSNDADAITIEDIAHSLSQICRFGGHTREFYSVAQHCCVVCDNAHPGNRLEALLHDAHEAYVGDVTSPLKRTIGLVFREIDESVQQRVLRRFGLVAGRIVGESSIIAADMRALSTEVRDLFDEPPVDGWDGRLPFSPFPERITPWAPQTAKREFLRRFNALTNH